MTIYSIYSQPTSISGAYCPIPNPRGRQEPTDGMSLPTDIKKSLLGFWFCPGIVLSCRIIPWYTRMEYSCPLHLLYSFLFNIDLGTPSNYARVPMCCRSYFILVTMEVKLRKQKNKIRWPIFWQST